LRSTSPKFEAKATPTLRQDAVAAGNPVEGDGGELSQSTPMLLRGRYGGRGANKRSPAGAGDRPGPRELNRRGKTPRSSVGFSTVSPPKNAPISPCAKAGDNQRRRDLGRFLGRMPDRPGHNLSNWRDDGGTRACGGGTFFMGRSTWPWRGGHSRRHRYVSGHTVGLVEWPAPSKAIGADCAVPGPGWPVIDVELGGDCDGLGGSAAPAG